MMEKSHNVLGFGSGSVYNEFGSAILVIISVPDPDLQDPPSLGLLGPDPGSDAFWSGMKKNPDLGAGMIIIDEFFFFNII